MTSKPSAPDELAVAHVRWLLRREQTDVVHVAEAGGATAEEIDGRDRRSCGRQNRALKVAEKGRGAFRLVDLVLVQRHAGYVPDDAVDQVPVLAEALRELGDAHVVVLVFRSSRVGLLQLVDVELGEQHGDVAQRVVHQLGHLRQGGLAAGPDDVADIGVWIGFEGGALGICRLGVALGCSVVGAGTAAGLWRKHWHIGVSETVGAGFGKVGKGRRGDSQRRRHAGDDESG